MNVATYVFFIYTIGTPKKLLNDITDSSKWPVSEKLSKNLLVSPLPGHLECEICLEILNDPVQTTCCGQGYCKNCIAQVKSKICPHCRAKVEIFPDKKSIRLINDLEILCPYHIENKCRWKGSASELNNHLTNCDIKPITCPLGCNKQFEKKNKDIHVTHLCSLRKIPCSYCQKQVMHKDMSEHHEVCPKMPVPCPNKCFSEVGITREEMSQHIEGCPNQAVKCKYSEFGCNEKEIKRKDYDNHLSSTIEQHLSLVAEYAKNERSARMKLEENERSARMKLEEKIAALERKLNALSK